MTTKHKARPAVVLIENTRVVAEDCRWCGATAGFGVHSKACPMGERYKQVQQLGGVAWPKGKPACDRSDFISDAYYQEWLTKNGFSEVA